MLNMTFPCDGYVTGWEYYRDKLNVNVYVDIWRRLSPTPFKSKLEGSTRTTLPQRFELIAKSVLATTKDTALGVNVEMLPNKIFVKRGDIIGLHYDAINSPVVIPSSNGGNGLVPQEELYQTVSLPRDNGDLTPGNLVDVTPWSSAKMVFAL
ncbi:unnamed protein product, partial [Owenia fusiformis]